MVSAYEPEKAGGALILIFVPEAFGRIAVFEGFREQAAKSLEKSGATVKLATYEGGHGWRGPLYDNIKEGVQWLEKNHAAGVKP